MMIGFGGVELRGLEPLAFALPARRSAQLSYSPVEVKVISKGNACLLIVASGGQAEVDKPHAGHQLAREEEAPVQLAAVDPEQIELIFAVCALDIASRRAPGRPDVHDHDVSVRAQPSPFALNAPDPAADVERQIASPMLGDGFKDRNAKAGCGQHDLLLAIAWLETYGPRIEAQTATRNPVAPHSTGPVEKLIDVELDRRIGNRVGSFTNRARLTKLLNLMTLDITGKADGRRWADTCANASTSPADARRTSAHTTIPKASTP